MEPRDYYLHDYKHDCEAVDFTVKFPSETLPGKATIENVKGRKGELSESINIVPGVTALVVLYAGTMKGQEPQIDTIIIDSDGVKYLVKSVTDTIYKTRFICQCVEKPGNATS